MKLTLKIIEKLFRKSKGQFLFAGFVINEKKEWKIYSFYTKIGDDEYEIKSDCDENYNEMVRIYKAMSCCSEIEAKNAIFYSKNKEAQQKTFDSYFPRCK